MGPLVTHVERIDTASSEGSPQWLFEAGEGLPPPCARTAPGCPPRDRTPASSALEDPKYCDVIVETWQRLTGKTTCPPGSLPSGEPPTPGAGATGERELPV